MKISKNQQILISKILKKITNKEHDTKQDQTRYQGSKNSSGMDTDLSQTERNKNSNRDDLENTQDKTRGL